MGKSRIKKDISPGTVSMVSEADRFANKMSREQGSFAKFILCQRARGYH
jgi:hypothetical protein